MSENKMSESDLNFRQKQRAEMKEKSTSFGRWLIEQIEASDLKHIENFRDAMGMHGQQVYNTFYGKKEVNLPFLFRIAEVLRINPSEVLWTFYYQRSPDTKEKAEMAWLLSVWGQLSRKEQELVETLIETMTKSHPQPLPYEKLMNKEAP